VCLASVKPVGISPTAYLLRKLAPAKVYYLIDSAVV